MLANITKLFKTMLFHCRMNYGRCNARILLPGFLVPAVSTKPKIMQPPFHLITCALPVSLYQPFQRERHEREMLILNVRYDKLCTQIRCNQTNHCSSCETRNGKQRDVNFSWGECEIMAEWNVHWINTRHPTVFSSLDWDTPESQRLYL